MSEAATTFLRQHGNRSLVSLGCGNWLNRIDNHVRLFIECDLEYYIAIDRLTQIDFNRESIFSDVAQIQPLLEKYYGGKADEFFEKIKVFPSTHVEQLTDLESKVIVCQRVLPFRHWENTIKSMNPMLILQEDLNGCELQTISGKLYKRTFPGIVHYNLQAFRPNRLFPGEKNIILWRRRDFFPCQYDTKPWWARLFFRFSYFRTAQ